MDVDLAEVARRVVRDSLQLGEDDSLEVEAGEHVLPLAKEIVKEARRAGADTIIVVDSDDLWYEAVLNLPLEWLREPSRLQKAVRGDATAVVYTGGLEDPRGMRDIPAERWRANSEGADATYKPFEDSPIPTVFLALGMVTEARARSYGFDRAEWYGSVAAAIAADPSSLRKRGEAIANKLRGARRGRVVAGGGTDFEFEFHGSEPAVFTGEVRPVEGLKSSYFASLPSGSVSIALKQGSGQGRVVSTADIPQMGDFIQHLTWEFEGGRLVRVDASQHLDFFMTRWTDDVRQKGAEQLGYLSVGLNPQAKFGFLENEIVEGVVTVGIGDNESLGGTNECGFGFGIHLRDATLEVDGEAVVEKGQLAI
jgi:leucyl aminopeptidase (aminopeptidase T)